MLLLFHLAVAAVFFDILYHRIPNGLIFMGLILGLICQISSSGLFGFLLFCAGVILPVMILGSLFYFRMMGAGDIKLLCVAGSFLGPVTGLLCIFYTFLIGGILSAVLLLKRRNLVRRIVYFQNYVTQYLQTKQWSPYMNKQDRDSHLCFSIPVFLSLLFHFGGIY